MLIVICLNGNSNHYNLEELLELIQKQIKMTIWVTCKEHTKIIHTGNVLIVKENLMKKLQLVIFQYVLKRQRKTQSRVKNQHQ